MKHRPRGNVRRGTRAFRALRAEALALLGPDGWRVWTCPICLQGVPTETEITLDHYGSEVWIHDPGNKRGIDAQTIRENSRLICRSCNSTRGRGRTDQRVAQLRERKLKQSKQTTNKTRATTTTSTTTTTGSWQLTPKRKDKTSDDVS